MVFLGADEAALILAAVSIAEPFAASLEFGACGAVVVISVTV
jgi:hypothetical protein